MYRHGTLSNSTLITSCMLTKAAAITTCSAPQTFESRCTQLTAPFLDYLMRESSSAHAAASGSAAGGPPGQAAPQGGAETAANRRGAHSQAEQMLDSAFADVPQAWRPLETQEFESADGFGRPAEIYGYMPQQVGCTLVALVPTSMNCTDTLRECRVMCKCFK